jgi:Ca-activated chloride channel family protein
MPFSVRADRKLIRTTARSRRFVRVEITAPEAPRRVDRIPVNLAFVIDRSGSMGGDKIRKAREAAIQGIRALRPEDRFAVVAYDDHVDVVVPSSLATPEARAAAEERIAGIGDRGSTDLHAGWLAGCEEIGRTLRDDAVGRCLLLTDGLANVGITAHHEIVARAAALRQRRITTSAFGVGSDFDEGLLAQIAEAGGGNFHFIEGASQIPDFIGAEVGEALAITARDVVLVVEAGEGALVESLNDFPCARQGDSWRIELGSMVGGQMLDPVLCLTLPGGTKGATREVRVRVEDREGALGAPSASVSFTWAGRAESDAQERDRLVDRRVAFLYAARAGREALAHNRAGDYGAARRVLKACLERIRRYAGDDTEIQAIVRDLEEKTEQYSAEMDPIARKVGHYGWTLGIKSRQRPRVTRRPPPPRDPKLILLASGPLDAVVRPALAHLALADPALFRDVVLHDAPAPAPGTQGSLLSPADEIDLVYGAAPAGPPDATRIVFTKLRLGDNWFSHWHELRRTAVVSMADWSAASTVPAEAFVAYEIVLHALRLLGPSYAPEKLMHDDTRGCLFDFCESRTDVKPKLLAGQICDPCRQSLAAAGIPADRALNLVNAVRVLAATPPAVH